jgi:hypothetical protein
MKGVKRLILLNVENLIKEHGIGEVHLNIVKMFFL